MPTLSFLGTGSIPTASRNSQSLLLETEGLGIMIDCGEGTQRQLLQLANSSYEHISYLFLTHEHIDHIYGIAGLVYLLLGRHPDKTLTIYGPSAALALARGLVDLVGSDFEDRLRWVELKHKDSLDFAYWRCEAFRTYHTETSLGYSFYLEGSKVSFLGDMALPNIHAFTEVGNSVHSSDALVADAVHITEIEAARIAKSANVKSLYLMPILLGSSTREIHVRTSAIFPNSHVPSDLERISI